MNTGFLLDMDGVIYRENHLISGAAELIQIFQEKSIPFLFLTNNSAPTPEDLVVKLRHLGIPDLAPRHFYTSAINTADFLSETHPCCTAFVIGEAGLNAALQRHKIANDSIKPTYVVVGEGTPNYDRIAKAHELIERGARLVVTNPDNWCPVSASATRPGAGALAAYLEASTGQRAYYLGKPNPYMFTQARKRLGTRAQTVVMVGDTMETDMKGAIESGLQAYLVLTGSSQREDLNNYVYQPTRILESIAELVDEFGSDKAFSKSLIADSQVAQKNARGNRHRSEDKLARLHRPRPAMVK